MVSSSLMFMSMVFGIINTIAAGGWLYAIFFILFASLLLNGLGEIKGKEEKRK